MNFKTFLFAAAATALTSTAALSVGQDVIDQITSDLASQGYTRIVVRNMSNTVKIEAYGPNGTLERLYRADGSVARSEGAGSRDVVIGQATTDDRGMGNDSQFGSDPDHGGQDGSNDGAGHRDNGNESHGSGHDSNDNNGHDSNDNSGRDSHDNQGSGHDRTDSHGAGHDSNDRDHGDTGGDRDKGGADRY